jgi:hypothetical protein
MLKRDGGRERSIKKCKVGTRGSIEGETKAGMSSASPQLLISTSLKWRPRHGDKQDLLKEEGGAGSTWVGPPPQGSKFSQTEYDT